MAKREIKELTSEQVTRMKSLVLDALAKGKPWTTVYSEQIALNGEMEFTYKDIRYWGNIFKKNKDYVPRVLKWSYEEKLKVLTHAAKHGVLETSRFFNISREHITDMNTEMGGIYEPGDTPKEVPLWQKKRALQWAAAYNKKYNSFSGIKEAAKKFNINDRLLYNCNKVYKIVQTQFNAKKIKLATDKINNIVSLADNFKRGPGDYNLSALSRATGSTTATVKKILDEFVISATNTH